MSPTFIEGGLEDAILEDAIREVVEFAGNNSTLANQRARITARHLQLAVCRDAELNKLFRNVSLTPGTMMKQKPRSFSV